MAVAASQEHRSPEEHSESGGAAPPNSLLVWRDHMSNFALLLPNSLTPMPIRMAHLEIMDKVPDGPVQPGDEVG